MNIRSRRARARRTAVVVLAAAMTVSACTFVGPDKEKSSDCGLTLGVLEPISGAAAGLGRPVLEGVKAAVADINANGGVKGCKVELNSQDYKSQPSVAVSRVQKLIDDEVYGIIGPNQGSATLAINPIVERAQIPVCAFNNTISITKKGNPYIYRCQANDEDNVRAAVGFLKKEFSAKRIAIMHTDDAYGTDAANALGGVAKEPDTRVTVAGTASFPYTATNTSAEWSRVAAKKPDGYILWGSGTSLAVALKDARQLGIEEPIIASQGLASAPIIKAAGKAAEDVYVLDLYNPAELTEEQRRVGAVLRERKGDDYEPTLYEYIGWDAVHLYARAYEKSPEDARAGLDGLGSVSLAAGEYSFSAKDHDGLGLDNIWINQIRDQDLVGVTTGNSR